MEQHDLIEKQEIREKGAKPSVLGFVFALAKKASTGHRKTQIISLVILLMTLVVISIALNLMSQKKQEEVVFPETYIASPSPKPSVDPSLENITQRVSDYGEKLNSLESYQKKLVYPIVDLAISFEE